MFFLLFRPPKSFLDREWSNIGGEGFPRKGTQSYFDHLFSKKPSDWSENPALYHRTPQMFFSCFLKIHHIQMLAATWLKTVLETPIKYFSVD